MKAIAANIFLTKRLSCEAERTIVQTHALA